MDEQVYHKATRAAVTAIAKKAGFKHAEQNATEQLASVAQAFIRQMAINALGNANEEGRHEINADDVDAAMESVNVNPTSLNWFLLEVRRTKTGKEALRNFPQPNERVFLHMPKPNPHTRITTPPSALVSTTPTPQLRNTPPPAHLPPLPHTTDSAKSSKSPEPSAAGEESDKEKTATAEADKTAAAVQRASPPPSAATQMDVREEHRIPTAEATEGGKRQPQHAAAAVTAGGGRGGGGGGGGGGEQEGEGEEEEATTRPAAHEAQEPAAATTAATTTSTTATTKPSDEFDDFFRSLEDEGVKIEDGVALPPTIEDNPAYDAPAEFVPVPLSPPRPTRATEPAPHHKPSKTKTSKPGRSSTRASKTATPTPADKSRTKSPAAVPPASTSQSKGKDRGAASATAATTASKTASKAATPTAKPVKAAESRAPLKMKLAAAPSPSSQPKASPAARRASGDGERPTKRAKTASPAALSHAAASTAPAPSSSSTSASAPGAASESPPRARASPATPAAGSGVARPTAKLPQQRPSAASPARTKEEAVTPAVPLSAPAKTKETKTTATAAAAAPQKLKLSIKFGGKAVGGEKPAASVTEAKKQERKDKAKEAKDATKVKEEKKVEKGKKREGSALPMLTPAQPTLTPQPVVPASSSAAAKEKSKKKAPAPKPSPSPKPKPHVKASALVPDRSSKSRRESKQGVAHGKAVASPAKRSKTADAAAPRASEGKQRKAARDRGSTRGSTSASAGSTPKAPRHAHARSVFAELNKKLKPMSPQMIVNEGARLLYEREQQPSLPGTGPPYCSDACKLGEAARYSEAGNYIACSLCDKWYHTDCSVGVFFANMPAFFCDKCDAQIPIDYEWLRIAMTKMKERKVKHESTRQVSLLEVFGPPVVSLLAPDARVAYLQLIKEPMGVYADFETIDKKLRGRKYTRWSPFLLDVARISINCRVFNRDNKEYTFYADALGIMVESLVEVSVPFFRRLLR
ncbi:hypothetical protein PTSG_01938 [Salpingoeca rosetta]|uniref:Bromo domain-containing protein n=1 Tax=Salpingoeca rosetta (strain ATCC 50818 / BSB-021) TaxID=946362 RepID=F2TZE0_SALR5|nr:uncharacterized protein PTSG_01938 [Salpingoeca rosetta]EGD78964.1 hypothetical protein PTSG_01938 [Salpingoeca rosetta]|eukprot:XP_004997920.1 hypothetical protein PTSG_01938 [Salpingoeca rosetta]